MSSAPTIKIGLCVSGDDLEPEELTFHTGIVPTEIGRKGKCASGAKWPARENFWVFELRQECYSLDDVMVSLLDMVWHRRQAIIDYVESKNSSSISLICNITIEDERPVYELSACTMERMVSFNAEFLMDIFDYS